MRKTGMGFLIAFFLTAMTAWGEPFKKGQVFISAYAGFIPVDGNWDVMYNLCFESAISPTVSVGFAYSQKQSSAGKKDQLIIPCQGNPAAVPGNLVFADITTRLFCLEGKYHFSFPALDRMDLFFGAGFGFELNKKKSLDFTYSGSELIIDDLVTSHYYLVANFFGGVSHYLAQNLALTAKLGYQYSGISGADAVLSVGVTFKIR